VEPNIVQVKHCTVLQRTVDRDSVHAVQASLYIRSNRESLVAVLLNSCAGINSIYACVFVCTPGDINNKAAAVLRIKERSVDNEREECTWLMKTNRTIDSDLIAA